MNENGYEGDMIMIDRLSSLTFYNDYEWNCGEPITLDDISFAILSNQPEEIKPFGDNRKHFPEESKTTKWHIGRVLYFINHPDEIKNIDIDNVCEGFFDILPIPLITDGNHRFLAAIWLHSQGKMEKVHCRYGGRIDLLDYLTGSSDCRPEY